MSKKTTLGIAGVCVLALATLVLFRPARNAPEAAGAGPEQKAVGEEPEKLDLNTAAEEPKKTDDSPSQPSTPPPAKPKVTDKQPEDVYAGVKAEKVPLLKRVETLLEPLTDSGGLVNKAARDGGELLAEKTARAKAVMQLSQYRLVLTPEARVKMLQLTGRVPQYRPGGSFSRHRTNRGSALSEEWAALLSEAEGYCARKSEPVSSSTRRPPRKSRPSTRSSTN